MSARSRREKRRKLRIKRIIQKSRYRRNAGYAMPAERRIKL